MQTYAVIHKNPLGNITRVQTIRAKTVTEAAYWFGFSFEGVVTDNLGTDAPFILMVTQGGGYTAYLYPTTELVA